MGGADLLANGVNYGITLDYIMELSFPLTLAPTLSLSSKSKEEKEEELIKQLLLMRK